MIWSWDAHRLDRVVEDPGQRVLYYLAEGAPKRAFVREQLMLIPENTELPPDSREKVVIRSTKLLLVDPRN